MEGLIRDAGISRLASQVARRRGLSSRAHVGRLVNKGDRRRGKVILFSLLNVFQSDSQLVARVTACRSGFSAWPGASSGPLSTRSRHDRQNNKQQETVVVCTSDNDPAPVRSPFWPSLSLLSLFRSPPSFFSPLLPVDRLVVFCVCVSSPLSHHWSGRSGGGC